MTRRSSDTGPFYLRLLAFAAACFAGAFALPAQANLLPPGTAPVPPDTFSFPANSLALFAEAGFSATASPNGTLIFEMVSTVYSDPNNIFGAGDLDFMYQVTNDPSSTANITRASAIGFTSFATDVGFTAAGSGLPQNSFVDGSVSPQLVDRDNSGVVGFTFAGPSPGPIMPGQTSSVLVIETNAKDFVFDPRQVSITNDGVANIGALQPVPEPASGLVTALLLAGCLGRGRRAC